MGILDSLNFLKGWRPSRPPLEKYYGYFIAAAVAWAIADLILLAYRPSMLPSEAPPVRQERPKPPPMAQLSAYNAITDRNIFNEDGKIPPALASDGGEAVDQAPVLSQLPLDLLGTIVHINPKRSIATIKVRSANQTFSYRPEDEIQGMARIVRVERKRVIFTNLNNRRLEYIEIPDDMAFKLDIQRPMSTESTDIIQRRGDFDFAIKRSDLENLTANLSSLLQQARMEPRITPDGGVDGFCFVSIQPGTVYEKLGFRVGDCIKSVNREPINSPGKAMQVYQELKNSNFVQLGVERDGRDENFNYTIQ